MWFLFLKSKGKNKMKSRWSSGIWLGVRDESGEVIIGTDEGVIKCRTVKRKGTKEERWTSGQVEDMKGTPWEPEPGRDEAEVGVRLRVWSERERVEGPRIPEGVDRPKIGRRFRILREDVEKYNPTPGCQGCHNAMVGKAAVNHKEECRERMAQSMMADENYRHHDRISDEAERLSGQERHRIERVETKSVPIVPIEGDLKIDDEAMEEVEEEGDIMDDNTLMRLGISEEWEEASGKLN